MRISPSPPPRGLAEGLGRVLLDLGMRREALDLFTRTGEGERAALGRASALAGLGRVAEADDILESLLSKGPASAPLLAIRSYVLAMRGRMEEARKAAEEATRLDPDSVAPWYYRTLIDDDPLDDESIVSMKHLDEKKELGEGEEICLHYALASALDARGEHSEAFGHAVRANELQKSLNERLGRGFDPSALEGFVSRTIERFTAKFMAEVSTGNPAVLPVFVTGLPRSGTTLVERILSTHPAVHGAGELDGIPRLAGAFLGKKTGRIDPSKEAERHLDHLRSLSPSAERVIDKNPANLFHIGIISILFPASRVIHISRDPWDTALSSYFGNLVNYPCMNDLSHIRSFASSAGKVMEYWRGAATIPIMDIRYEDLVREPGETAERLFRFLDLEPPEAPLEFHLLPGDVTSMSFAQVRRPLYGSSIGRWAPYRRLVGAGLLDEA